jgi:hypothetical protein
MNLRNLLMPLLLFGSLNAMTQVSSADDIGRETNTYANKVNYSGQGLIADGFGGHDLNTERCGVENGADIDGPYLLWVLTANKAKNANISGPWGNVPMTKTSNGAFKYISAWYAPMTLPGNVSASFDGIRTNAQLVISHGCRPITSIGAWCSPGFWRNATDAAWSLTGFKRTDYFNTTVYSGWYGATFMANPVLQNVLAQPQIYSGPSLAGTSGYPLNAFNATGAMLTEALPGFNFDYSVMQSGNSESCPIDHFGNLKD